VLVFEVRPALVACDNVVKMGSPHRFQRGKKLTTFCDSHLPEVTCQMAWDRAEMAFFIPSALCNKLKTVAGDMSRASASEYAEKHGSLSNQAMVLASR
jgi:hypothetical protein